MLKGIDVSRWQGAIDWAKVKPQVDFAYIKAGGADDVAPYTDSMAAGNAVLARQAGVPFGWYWFFSGRNEVDAQLATIASFRLSHGGDVLPWVIDIEDSTRGADDILGGLKLAQLVGQLTGQMSLIYTGAWWWNPRWDLARRMGAPEAVPLGLWVAAYTSEVIIPRGWTDWTVWQHTDKGRIEGIAGAVDLDHARAPFWDAPRELVMPKYEITATALNLRAEPNALSERLADPLLPQGAVIEADPPVDGWHKVKLTNGQPTAGGLVFTPPAKYRVPDVAYISAAWTKPVVAPPPPATRKPYRIGVHVIGHWRAADQALAAGAPVIVGMHGKAEIVQRAMAYPDRIFVYRYYVRGVVTPKQVFDGLAINNADPRNVWFVGLNENDNFGDDAEALRGRVLWDGELFDRIQQTAPGARYFGGSFGHGAPGGVEDPNGPVADALRGYIPLWKKGMGIDLHNYTHGKRFPDDPAPDSPIDDPRWYEKRGDFWFTSVGLDPRVGGGFIHSETGVEAGHGGYNWANYSPAQFARHIRTLSEIGRGPIAIPGGPNAGTWPSVDEAGALYMFGDDATWTGGYDTRRWLPELRAFWAEGR